MILTFLDDCTYQVSRPYKVFNLLAVANMSAKTPQDLCGGVQLPLGCHRNHHPLISKILTKYVWYNFDNTCKTSFSNLEEQSHKSKKFVQQKTFSIFSSTFVSFWNISKLLDPNAKKYRQINISFSFGWKFVKGCLFLLSPIGYKVVGLGLIFSLKKLRYSFYQCTKHWDIS